jgi:hypothetical protein
MMPSPIIFAATISASTVAGRSKGDDTKIASGRHFLCIHSEIEHRQSAFISDLFSHMEAK